MNITKNILSIIVLVMVSTVVSAQCYNSTPYLSANAPTSGSTQISSCTYQSEYNTINNVAATTTYTSTYSLGGCITVTQGSPTGPVMATGNSPLNWTSTVAGTYYVHYTTSCSPTCGQAFSCGTTTIAYVSSGGGGGGTGPCANITPLIGCGTSISASPSGTGTPWNITSCGFSTPGTEMIFSFTATSSGIHSIDVTGISGGYIDMFWMDASTGCSSNSASWNCVSDILTTGNYGSMNWTAGNTYYILIDPEGTGSYNIVFDVNCPNPAGPVTASDCDDAIPVCTDLGFQIDPNGYGNVDELCTGCISNPSTNPSSSNFGCLQSGELNSTWFTVNVAVGGTLEFSFGAAGSGIYCYDWIMWPYNGLSTCNAIINNTQAPVSCNWNSPCDGFTGMSNNPLPAGASAGNFEPGMTVSAGDQFVICFSNYSSALTTVPLNFFGTADISCTLLPVELVSFNGKDQGGYNLLTWTTLAEVNNSHFDLERSFDGVHFEKIAEIEGAGTSLSENDYRFNDYINNVNGVTYYRLKQVDFNGQFKHSNIITIAENKDVSFEIISAFPNPADDKISLRFSSPNSEQLNINVVDLSGNKVSSTLFNGVSGINQAEISLGPYKAGFYFIEVESIDTNEKELVKISIK